MFGFYVIKLATSLKPEKIKAVRIEISGYGHCWRRASSQHPHDVDPSKMWIQLIIHCLTSSHSYTSEYNLRTRGY